MAKLKLKAESRTVVLVTFTGKKDEKHIPALLSWLKARGISYAAPGLGGAVAKRG
jgi:hypothetical protein